jgi:peptidylprolyl isomerase
VEVHVRLRLPALGLAAALIFAACGDDEPLSTEVESSTTTEQQDSTDGTDGGDSSDATEPAQPDPEQLTDQIAAAVPDSETAREVLARTPPEPEGPPADLAADALEVTNLIEGTSDEPPAAAGDTLIAHYVGVLSDGETFDESWTEGIPFDVAIGTGAVIPGWDEGLVGVKAGDRVRLEIGSDLAYGAEGQGSIPPDSPLAFEIDVVGIIPAEG